VKYEMYEGSKRTKFQVSEDKVQSSDNNDLAPESII
jgi:hypothetical protein